MAEGFKIRFMLVWACVMLFWVCVMLVWACVSVRKGRAGKWDHLPTKSGFNQSPSLVVQLGLVSTRI